MKQIFLASYAKFLVSMDKSWLYLTKITCFYFFKVKGWARRSYWSYILNDCANFKTLAQLAMELFHNCFIWQFHRSKTSEGLQNVSDYSTAISMLLTPPRSELFEKRVGFKVVTNGWSRIIYHLLIHSPKYELGIRWFLKRTVFALLLLTSTLYNVFFFYYYFFS
jgi:hypothetical protein